MISEPDRREQHNDPEAEQDRLTHALRVLFRKNDSVIGIIGKTQGVKMAARPKPNATSRKLRQTLVAGFVSVGAAEWPAALAGELGVPRRSRLAAVRPDQC